MLVAMPTAMPADAVDQQVGEAGRQDRRLRGACRRSWARSRRSPRRCPAASPSPAGVSRDSVLWLTKPLVTNAWSSVSTRRLVDRLHAGVRTDVDLGVVEAAVDQRLDHRERLGVGDVRADLVAVAAPTARSGRRCAGAASRARSSGPAPCARRKSPTNGTWSLLMRGARPPGTVASSASQLRLLRPRKPTCWRRSGRRAGW